jgi:outer membrane protein TolC
LVQNTRVEAAVKTLDLSRERYRIVEEKVNIGSSSGMDLHQARLDFNADSSYLVRQKELLMNSYIHLNRLMNMDFTLKSYVDDSIILGTVLSLSDLELATINNNTTLLASALGIRQSNADLKQARAARYPTLNFISGYSLSRIDAPTESIIFREANTFSYGLEGSLGIFNGFQINRNIKNASLELENKNLGYEDAKLEVLSELHSLYNTYVNNLMMVGFEQENVLVSQTNLDLALERYDLGALSGLGFREFQISYLNAVDRSLAAMYQAKVIELSLLIISGQMDEFVMRIR